MVSQHGRLKPLAEIRCEKEAMQQRRETAMQNRHDDELLRRIENLERRSADMFRMHAADALRTFAAGGRFDVYTRGVLVFDEVDPRVGWVSLDAINQAEVARDLLTPRPLLRAWELRGYVETYSQEHYYLVLWYCSSLDCDCPGSLIHMPQNSVLGAARGARGHAPAV